eukprot:g1167.t1
MSDAATVSKAPKAADANQPDKKKKTPKSKKPENSLKNWVPKQRPVVKEKPSFNRLEQYDYVREITKRNVWYYRDRLSTPRGPCTLPVLRECWVNGVIDENTLVWGQGLIDWLPVKNIRTLVPQIRTPEVRFSTWIKKNFALKPAIAHAHRMNPEKYPKSCSQVDNMY